MKAYTEMDPELIAKLVQPYVDAGETDLLSREKTKEDAFLRNHTCPTCGCGSMTPFFVNAAHAYQSGSILPRKALRCSACGAEYDPHTNITLSTGNIAKAIELIRANQLPGFNEPTE